MIELKGWNEQQYKDSVKVPSNAIPYHKSAFVTAVVTATERTLFEEQILTTVNGLRLAGFVFSSGANHIAAQWRFYRNGNPYDDTLGFLTLGAAVNAVWVPIYGVWGAGEILKVSVLNTSGANKDYAFYTFGWHF